MNIPDYLSGMPGHTLINSREAMEVLGVGRFKFNSMVSDGRMAAPIVRKGDLKTGSNFAAYKSTFYRLEDVLNAKLN